MKIEIDTKHDSPEEIRKVIKMLQHLVGEHPYSNSEQAIEQTAFSPGSADSFTAMFGSASQESKQEEPKKKAPIELMTY